MYFKTTIGIFCLSAGAIFLAINSVILWRGAARWAHDDVEWVMWGLAAAIVPWAIAIMPALVSDTWRRTWFGLWRPSSGTLVVMGVWVLFIVYNVVNGAGAIGLQRQDKIAEREHQSDDLAALKFQRQTLVSQIESIPKHRPAETMERLIAAEKQDKRWSQTEGCKDATRNRSRAFCENVAVLESELGSAKAAEALSQKLDKVDEKIRGSNPVITVGGSVDPQAELVADVVNVFGTGQLSTKTVSRWLPAMTPIILEVGAATFWHFGFSIMGLGMYGANRTRIAQDAPFNPAPLPSPERLNAVPEASLELISNQQKLAYWFFRNCARPIADGAMPESEWYDHYTAICRQHNDLPMHIDLFRRIAAKFMTRIEQLDGVTYYSGMLPKIPEEAV